MEDTPVDIIISIYIRGARLDQVISSIRQSTYTNFTLWLLDKSKDNLAKECAMRHVAADSRVIYQRVPMGDLGVTRNHGVTLSSAPYILFINDDCTVDPEWIAESVAELRNPETWMVFGRVLPGEEAPTGAERDGAVLALKVYNKRQVYRGNRFNLGFGHGHNIGVHRERFEQLGGYDEYLASNYLGAWDERDIGYRTLRLGGQIVYNPKSVVYHCHWQHWSEAKRSGRIYAMGVGSAVAKYMRCGDPLAFCMLLEWVLSQGVRQALSGILKWRSKDRAQYALGQMYYPWIGLLRGLQQPVDRDYVLFRGLADPRGDTRFLLGSPTPKGQSEQH